MQRTGPPRRSKAPPTRGAEAVGAAREEAMAAEDKAPKKGAQEGYIDLQMHLKP